MEDFLGSEEGKRYNYCSCYCVLLRARRGNERKEGELMFSGSGKERVLWCFY